MRVAVLGTGTMGAGMARSLLRDAHEVTVWNRTRDKAEALVDDGACVADDPSSCVEGAEVIVTMLFDESATARAARTFLSASADGAVWLQCATVGPAGAKRLADLADDASVRTLDCPVLGTKAPAEKGALTALVSGDAESIDRVGPVLASMTVKKVVAGSRPGEASALKLACNAMVASLTAATAQSVTMASEMGVDPKLVLSALDGGPLGAPYTQIKGTAMIDEDFTPSFGIDGVIKDLDLMIGAVPERTARMLEVVRSAFADASAAGHGDDDMAAVVTAFRPA
ncbi:NAD(P)-dependent oxidoreductase [Actinomycetes bacterium M1A6_2h]